AAQRLCWLDQNLALHVSIPAGTFSTTERNTRTETRSSTRGEGTPEGIEDSHADALGLQRFGSTSKTSRCLRRCTDSCPSAQRPRQHGAILGINSWLRRKQIQYPSPRNQTSKEGSQPTVIGFHIGTKRFSLFVPFCLFWSPTP